MHTRVGCSCVCTCVNMCLISHSTKHELGLHCVALLQQGPLIRQGPLMRQGSLMRLGSLMRQGSLMRLGSLMRQGSFLQQGSLLQGCLLDAHPWVHALVCACSCIHMCTHVHMPKCAGVCICDCVHACVCFYHYMKTSE